MSPILVIGKLNNSYIFSSESCGLDIIGAELIRDIDPGEIVIIKNNKVESIKPFKKTILKPCLFEYIYFSRPDSIIKNTSFYEYRKKLGSQLAKESHVDSDLIVPVPDSGVPAAIGYSEKVNKNVVRKYGFSVFFQN